MAALTTRVFLSEYPLNAYSRTPRLRALELLEPITQAMSTRPFRLPIAQAAGQVHLSDDSIVIEDRTGFCARFDLADWQGLVDALVSLKVDGDLIQRIEERAHRVALAQDEAPAAMSFDWMIQAGQQTLILDGVTIAIKMARDCVRLCVDDVDIANHVLAEDELPAPYVDAYRTRVETQYANGTWPPR